MNHYMNIKKLPKWQQETIQATEFEHYLKQLDKRITTLKAIEDKIIFKGSIRMKCKFYNTLDQIIFFSDKMQQMLKDKLSLKLQDR